MPPTTHCFGGTGAGREVNPRATVKPMQLRDATTADFAQILHLNHASVHFLSPLSQERLVLLHHMAAYHRVAHEGGQVRGFLLAFCEGAAYDSPNYQWFARAYSRFVYVDRIVVAGDCHGRGIGQRFYQDLFAFARQVRAPRVTLEIDFEPPNPVSARFHARQGFREVGAQWVAGGSKQVSLQSLTIDAGLDQCRVA